MLTVGTCTPDVGLNFSHSMSSPKVAWLSQRSEPHWGIKFLMRYLQEEDYRVYPVTRNQLHSAKFEDCQIFVIEVQDRVDSTLLETILDLRVQTLALIIILMEDPSSAEVVQILGNGADAVWTLNEPAQVLRARTRSLLRRLKGFDMEL